MGPLLLLQKCHGILSLKDKTAVKPQFSSNSEKVPNLQGFMYTILCGRSSLTSDHRTFQNT